MLRHNFGGSLKHEVEPYLKAHCHWSLSLFLSKYLLCKYSGNCGAPSQYYFDVQNIVF